MRFYQMNLRQTTISINSVMNGRHLQALSSGLVVLVHGLKAYIEPSRSGLDSGSVRVRKRQSVFVVKI